MFNPFEEPTPSRLVMDPQSEEWIIFAPGRADRPGAGPHSAAGVCHFCPENLDPGEILSVDGHGEHRLTAITNRYPVLGLREDEPYGRQEIIVEGTTHRSLPSWSLAELDRLFAFYATRLAEVKRDPSIKYVLLFRNQGHEAGSSQPHPHAQLYAMAGVSPRLMRERLRRVQYRAHAHACLSCLALREVEGGSLVIFEDERALAFANPTGRFAYEVRVLTKRHADNLSLLTAMERRSFAAALRACLPFLARQKLAFNYYTQELVDDPDQHCELRLLPHQNFQGGLELSSGIYVNPVDPEAAAKAYCEASVGA